MDLSQAGLASSAGVAAGLTQQERASAARVSRTVLSRLERGKARAEQMRRLEANRSRHLRPAVALAIDALAAEPLIARARERVELWRTRRSCSPRYIEAWAQALNRPPAGGPWP